MQAQNSKVTYLQEFTVNFGRLKLGKHEFEYGINAAFFEPFETDLIKKCNTTTKLTVDKTRANLLNFVFEITGEADFECDRCTDILAYPIEGTFGIIVKLEEQKQLDDDDEIIYLSPDAYEFNVAELIYDFHILSIPFKKECLRKNHPSCLRIDQIINGNSYHDANNKESDEGDPRWSELKKLL